MTIIMHILPMPQPPCRRVVLIAVPGAQSLDVTGPLEAFAGANHELAAPGYRLVVASPGGGAITTSSGLVFATVRLATLRATAKDTVLVAGADERGVRAAIADGGLTAWLARAAPTVERIGSVCSGAFALAAAGLLAGRRVATHWMYMDLLPAFGATPVAERVVIDRNRITAGGVTAGIDFGLRVIAEIAGVEAAQTAQLELEYDPQPPFACGHPRSAPAELVASVRARFAARMAEREAQLARLRAAAPAR